MSADGREQQVLPLDVEEAIVLRGAFNVVCKILSRPYLGVPPGIPIDRERKALFERLADRSEGILQSPVIDRDTDTVLRLKSAEAQAVLDVVGALETMLQDEAGRELLAAVGFLVEPDQDVDRSELESLEAVFNRIDPTGVRDVPDAESG